LAISPPPSARNELELLLAAVLLMAATGGPALEGPLKVEVRCSIRVA